MLIIKNSNEGIEENITSIEKKYNIILPEIYKRFLKKYNGGETRNTFFGEYTIGYFVGFGNVRGSINMEYDLDEYIDAGFFPIADSMILMGLNMNNYGKIYFFDRYDGELVLLADDLKIFIGGCVSEMFENKTPLQQEAAMIKMGMGHTITDKLREEWNRTYEYYLTHPQEECILD